MKERATRLFRRMFAPRILACSAFVLNQDPPKKIQSLTINLLPGNCRVDQLEGKEYVVVPMVILTEGVHAGSMGPLYYPKDELSKTPVVWNHKPIVVYHPTMNGEGISACDPVVLNNRKVGLMMNTRFEGGALKSEAWLDRARANAVDDRIMAAVDAKEMMELSTGVFIDVEDTDGKWKSEEYGGIARNYRPDHLALLPDQIGACSIADGAGLLRNKASKDPFVKGILQKLGLLDNQMSFSNIEGAVRTALMEKYNVNTANGPWIYVANVYPNFVIYEWDNKLWRLGYSASDTDITLSTDAPVEVVRVTEYRTVDGTFVGNQNHEPNTVMNKKKIIGILLANAVATLNGVALSANMTDDQLKTLNEEQLEAALTDVIKNAKAPAPAPEKKEAPAVNAEVKEPAKEPAKPAVAPATNVVKIEDYIAAAPVEIQEVLRNSMTVANEEKRKLVEQIMNSKSNPFQKVDLENKPLGELKMLAQLAAVPQAAPQRQGHYAGMAPVENSTGEEAPLEPPVLNFAK